MKLTYLLVIIAIIGFFSPFLVFKDINNFYDTYGFSGNNVLERPYVLITSIFMHGNLGHLLANILVWLFFGVAVEKELGTIKYLGVFFVGAFAGDLFSLFVYSSDSIGIGASAGIFALVGVGMLIKPLDLSLYPFIIPIPLALLGMMYIVYNIYGFFFDAQSNISYIAHFGGLAIGLTAGFRHEGKRRSLIIILASLAILMLSYTLFLLLL